jgi:hypothetical protein
MSESFTGRSQWKMLLRQNLRYINNRYEHSTNKSTQVALQYLYLWLNIASDYHMSSNMAIIKSGKHNEFIMKRIHLQSHSELLGLHQQ